MLLPLIARDLWYSGEPAAADSAERRRQVALERLADWNGEMSEHTPEPLIYAAWLRALKRRLARTSSGRWCAGAGRGAGLHRAGLPQRRRRRRPGAT